jgi:hypothetical protein
MSGTPGLVITIITARATTGGSMDRMFLYSGIMITVISTMILGIEGLRVEGAGFMGDFTAGALATVEAGLAMVGAVVTVEVVEVTEDNGQITEIL